MVKRTTSPKQELPKDRLLARLSLAFFGRPLFTLMLWLVLIVFGALSYTVLLKREGFPSINIPIAIVNGTYFVNDPAKVDAQVTKPLSDLALKQDGVSVVQASSTGNFYTMYVQYKESVDARKLTKELQSQVENQLKLPASVKPNFSVPYFGVTGGDAKKIDTLISLYNTSASAQSDTSDLIAPAQAAVDYLNKHKPSLVKTFFLQNPMQTAQDPATGQTATIQKNFDRYNIRTGNEIRSYSSVTIGVTSVDNADVIKLDNQIKPLLAQLQKQAGITNYKAVISASNAPSIQDEIHELQRVLLEGLIAVLIIGSIVIAVRASFITILSMITVILVTLGFLYTIGYSLNVITLFALILGLSLIVDDTIIMTEAIDAVRRTSKNPREIVRVAVRKISRAMVAATLTATLSFAPLLFVSGILGSFIRAVPVTIIASLLISLIVALVFIPFFARGILLGRKQLGGKGVLEIAEGIEHRIATFIGKPMLWAKGSSKRLFTVGITAVLISLGFVFAAGFVFSKVTFNIFPPTKDTNGLTVGLTFKPGTTIEQAEKITERADKLTAKTLGSYLIDSSYYGMGSETSATSYINIVSYEDRGPTSHDLIKKLKTAFDTSFPDAIATIGQLDIGPPSSAFVVQVRTEDRVKGYHLAHDIEKFLQTATLKRVSGTTAKFTNINVSTPDQYVRNGGELSIDVTASFNANDTTTLVTLAQEAVKNEFTSSKLANYGLSKETINFDLGQESENQDSFKSLAFAFPVMLLVIYLLLALEFRSLLQPLLIFMAIPFSLFGVTLGLYLTDNAFSFFAMLGFFALIGLSLKNTILLTDYANQSRRNGLGAVDSAVAALGERFRPLVATSLTAVVSLIPLAVTSPFWQGLAVVLIFGLLSSTLLVILVFPYYYLGGEFLRRHISRKAFFGWLIPTILLTTVAWVVFGATAPIILALVVFTLVTSALLARHHGSRTTR